MAFERQVRALGEKVPFAVAAADFNSDGRLDLFVTSAKCDCASFLPGLPGGQFPREEILHPGLVPRGAVVADLNGDANPDVAVGNAQSNDVAVFLGDGRGKFETRKFRAGFAPFDLAVADLDADGHLDIAVANESNPPAEVQPPGEVSVLYGDGRGNFAPAQSLQAGTFPADIEAGDLDGDGRVDLAVVNWFSRDVYLFFNRGGRRFSAPVAIAHGGAIAYAIAAADIDGDGDIDLLTGHVGGEVRIFANDSRGQFHLQGALRAEAGLRHVAVADMDRDGNLDIVTANSLAHTITVFRGLGSGKFAPPQSFSAGRTPRWVAIADLNGDELPDIAAANSTSGDLTLLYQVRRSSAGTGRPEGPSERGRTAAPPKR